MDGYWPCVAMPSSSESITFSRKWMARGKKGQKTANIKLQVEANNLCGTKAWQSRRFRVNENRNQSKKNQNTVYRHEIHSQNIMSTVKVRSLETRNPRFTIAWPSTRLVRRRCVMIGRFYYLHSPLLNNVRDHRPLATGLQKLVPIR